MSPPTNRVLGEIFVVQCAKLDYFEIAANQRPFAGSGPAASAIRPIS